MRDRITFILLTASFAIDNIWRFVTFNGDRYLHLNGVEGYYKDFHYWYLSNELRIILFMFAGFYMNNLAINRASFVSYLIIHIVCILQYLYMGINNENYYIFEIAYLLICYILYQKWKS